LSREYSIDPLEIIFAREVVRTNVTVLPVDATAAAIRAVFDGEPRRQEQRLFPIVDGNRQLVGAVARKRLRAWVDAPGQDSIAALIERSPVVANTDEPLRTVVYRMAESAVTRLPVVEPDGTFVGVIALSDLLTARTRILDAERRRERVLGTKWRLPQFLQF
jgi:CBS domain-containing protein